MTVKAAERDAEARRARLSRLPSLTGMRFIAALMVFFFHVSLPDFTPFGGDFADDAEWLFSKGGWVGVSFFFILSGFVLTWSARPGDTPRRFMRRRLVKLYPNHVVTFALSMLLFAGATATWKQWLPNILLVHTWIPDYNTFFGINPPSWSLACEVVFYLCFPVLHRWIKKIDPAHLWGWAAGLAALVMLIPAFSYAVLPSDPPMPNGFPVGVKQAWFVYLLPPVRMLEFAIGIIMARIVLTDRWINVKMVHALGLLIVGYAVALNVPWLYGLNAVCLIPIALLIPAAAVADVKDQPSPFRGKVMTWLGEVSFAFYLIHGVVIIYGTKFLHGKPYGLAAGLGLWAACAVISLILGHLLFKYVEMPMMKHWSKPRGERRDARPVAAVPAARAAEEATPVGANRSRD
ncbi:acyltransferase family protein [Streptomyces melanogenes]|uniref:Acyltransferase n=1 Tax=Streptomyces melanogenes TaxID=67326 RepID=A0ABZ1XKJ0_9ACTN|nr:acyltransferase [Streptomyces melanogenes]